MNEIQYVGEHLLPGKIAHFLLLLSFVSALFSTYTFYKAANNEQDKAWRSLGRIGYRLHGIGLFGLIGILFYVMVQHYYEYRYVFEHVSDDLPMRYILSAFWEGQEGSFLLWMFWHVILAGVVVWKGRKWEAPVVSIIMLIQAFLLSMILGVYVGWGDNLYKLGSNPTLLLRDTMQAPIFANAEYLSRITGRGLNPLLQNYWNTIHPPVTFLGFASTTMPFAFALAAMWKKDYASYITPLLRWGLFSAAFLGIGILMGGAWAYEALSFGGYWAWDPVENMSLVPWLILVAGVHTNLIAKSTGYSIRSTMLFYLLTFVLIIYSTFLTRSGILGETSAHAFTEMGLEWQLVIFVLFFLLLGLITFAFRYKSIPTKPKEESSYSREFWMFIGAIVLFFAGAIIATSSSLPVFNKIVNYFDPGYIGAVIEDPIPHYNKYQIWTSIFISMLAGASLFLRYKDQKWSPNKRNSFIKKIALHLLLAGVVTYLGSLWIDYKEFRYLLLSFTSWFAIISSIHYFITPNQWKLRAGAAAFSHLGFGLMIYGVITSGLNMKVVSTNPFAMKGLVDDETLSKVVSLIKGEPLFVNGYWITYKKDSLHGQFRTFDVQFDKIVDSTVVESFTLQPNVQFDREFKKVAASNPDTKHYLHKDIFTNIASLPRSQMDISLAQEIEDSLDYVSYLPAVGDTIFTRKNYGIVKDIIFEPAAQDSYDLSLAVEIEFKGLEDNKSYTIRPAIGVKDNLIYELPEIIDPYHLKVFVQDSFFSQVFNAEDELQYATYTIGRNESFLYKDFRVDLKGFADQITNENYEAEENDVSAGATILMTHQGRTALLEPVYLLRNSRSMSVKDYDPISGFHIRFEKIDPEKELFTFSVAKDKRQNLRVPLKIAEDVPRSDFIVFEAKEFPGINMFWLGAILMMLGFLLALSRRWKER